MICLQLGVDVYPSMLQLKHSRYNILYAIKLLAW